MVALSYRDVTTTERLGVHGFPAVINAPIIMSVRAGAGKTAHCNLQVDCAVRFKTQDRIDEGFLEGQEYTQQYRCRYGKLPHGNYNSTYTYHFLV